MRETKSSGTPSYNFSFVAVILLLKFNCYKLSESVNSDYYGTGNATHSILRFRDFEPRYHNNNKPAQLIANHPQSRADQDYDDEHNYANGSERHGRGFHFSASGEDVSVELEFIVPFFKVPVKRSMSLAREAIQGLFNLRTGALINTLVIVVAGASIAGIIKFLTTVLSVGTPSYVYGHKSAKAEGNYKHTSQNKNMRGLSAVLESKLDEYNIDVSACLQRSICGYLQRNRQTFYWSEDTDGYAKLIDALARHPYLDTFLEGTAVHDAIKASRSAENCEQIYRHCRMHLSVEQLKPLLRYLKIFNG